MTSEEFYRALHWRISTRHSIPKFDGPRSRTHIDAWLFILKVHALLHRLRIGYRLDSVDTFVQFAGFPRSGHSLIGSIIDAHPSARIAHELDTMGLIKKGFSPEQVLALIDQKALEFTRHGRHWNGYCHRISGGRHTANTRIQVLGDKKDVGALQWINQSPELLDELGKHFPVSRKWIVVLRNPFDNIASMSLSKSGLYDLIQTQTDSTADISDQVRSAQQAGEMTGEVLDDEIDAYERVCQTVERILCATPGDAQFILEHEALARAPHQTLVEILSFLNLNRDSEYLDKAAELLKTTPHRSRDWVRWPKVKQQRVENLINRYSFLASYRNNE